MRLIAVSLLCALALAGCATPKIEGEGKVPFDARAAAYINALGTGVIKGQVFLPHPNGQNFYGAGETVRLVPATAYAAERFSRLYGGKKFVPVGSIPVITPDPDYASYTRTTKAGAVGQFEFRDVAPGRYFIASQLIRQKTDSFLQEGGAFFETVTVTGSETAPLRVYVTGN